ncbi:UPF0193 protein EVG1 homolog [Teleopsis dalmanni]|uniref:UPF0193 protein EVG1 homolog n=1 Tax=Teleopsis dalmanni TaxID=139649 RepID=UPI0018CEF371|nr:UPF0193 protein EVG1 homolog [Teleopsis dalmanni]
MNSNYKNVGATKGTQIMWPSARIPQGGLFHSPKVEYSKETAELVQLLMRESRMSMLMRDKINYHLRNGEPLPKPTPPPPIDTSVDPDENALEILRRARNAKRKSLQQIMASGVYEMPNYRPRPTNRKPNEKAKFQLQEAMSGLSLSETVLKPKKQPKNEECTTSENIIDEILKQINDRAEWLAEMEQLGEGEKYRDEIRSQIADRLRKIKRLQERKHLEKLGARYVD